MSLSGDQITFAVDTERVLNILSSEIYDSPNALLRENLQNAYDAILMRVTHESSHFSEHSIQIEVKDKYISIEDTGIGMSEEILRNNFWRAGSSGKLTQLAEDAGVIGTFGIGALANFGVCTKLTVRTRHIDSTATLLSVAIRSDLAIAEECISLDKLEDTYPIGTKIEIDLDPDYKVSEAEAEAYLLPYVEYLPVAVALNGKIISLRSYTETFGGKVDGYKYVDEREITDGLYTATLKTSVGPQSQVSAYLRDVTFNGIRHGEMFLVQQGGQLFALRNYFGLAPAPIGGHYQFGGVANLMFLQPTAGREALSRESIEHLNKLINLVELEVSVDLSSTENGDGNLGFLKYVNSTGRLDLAGNVTISAFPDETAIPLKDVLNKYGENKPRYYSGRDSGTIITFSSPTTPLLHVSQNNPRRKLQLRYIRENLGLEEVPNEAVVTREYLESELTIAEAALSIRIAVTLEEDYLIHNSKVIFADISHGAPCLIKQNPDGTIFIFLSRKDTAIQSVLQCYESAYEVFPGFVKDYVRSHLYKLLSQYVPSSTREGTDALYKILQRNREVYRIEQKDRGEIEKLLGDYLKGDASFGEVLKRTSKTIRSQTQRVTKSQVGSIEQEIPDMASSPVQQAVEEQEVEGSREYPPTPPILRTDEETDKKILLTPESYPILNGFKTFLALSDRLFKRERDFFRLPHTTKIIWANHRVIYIFTTELSNMSLYYDIELKKKISNDSTFGGMFPTTTLIMKNRIFVPVAEPLDETFKITDEAKEFFVRYDLL